MRLPRAHRRARALARAAHVALLVARLTALAASAVLAIQASGSRVAAQARAQPSAAEFAVCPHCHDDPELLARAGLVRHGLMPFGARDSRELARGAPLGAWWFLESAHFRVAFGIDGCAVPATRAEQLAAELARLRDALPDVPKQPRKLDSALRLHLVVLRLEDAYARIQRAFGVRDADFPESRSASGPYMGDGRYLGEKDKFEFAIFPSVAAHNAWTRDFAGATVEGTLRWHFSPQHKLHASVPTADSDLRSDLGLHTHLVHNLAHMMLCAFKHHSYDAPIWIDEGLATYFEKELDPRATTIEGEEGGARSVRPPRDFAGLARSFAQQDRGQLVAHRDYSDLSGDDLVACWAIAKFWIEAHPREFAAFVGGVKGQLDARGVPSGSDLGGLQRRLLKELWGWNATDLDREWRAWFARAAK